MNIFSLLVLELNVYLEFKIKEIIAPDKKPIAAEIKGFKSKILLCNSVIKKLTKLFKIPTEANLYIL